MKEKRYTRKPEHLVRFWMNKLMQEKNADSVKVSIESNGKCTFQVKNDDIDEAYILTKTQDTKPKKLVFEVDGKILKYKSLRKAAESLGVARPTLTNIVNGHTKRSLALESAGIKFVGEE